MAIFYAAVKTFSRGRGQSSVNAAAYRAAACFTDERLGTTHNYSRKSGVLGVYMVAPAGAPTWSADPNQLWNRAEEPERKNGCVARELLVALPAELSDVQCATLAQAIASQLVERYGVATMTALHAPDKRGDQRNTHAHIMFTTRELGPNGFGRKTRVLDDRRTGPLEVEALRAMVAEQTNDHLAKAGHSVRVDHRRLEAQAIDAEERGDFAAAALLIRETTLHEGQATTSARRRGEATEQSIWNDEVSRDNANALEQTLARAMAEARAMETPARSDHVQAKIDHAREAVIETNKTPRDVPAAINVSRVPRARPSAGRGVRHRLGTRVGRASRAEGKDAAVLNAAAAQSSELRRAQGEMSQKYIDMIQEFVAEFGQRAVIVVDYARRLQWPIADARMLAQHQIRDPGCDVLLQHGIRADNAWRRAQTLAERRRDRYGDAMVATVRERHAFDGLEQSTDPPRWKRRTRREWAELRRRQREGLDRAHRREARAQVLVTELAMIHYTNKTRATRQIRDGIERKRRERYPVPSDVRAVQLLNGGAPKMEVRRVSNGLSLQQLAPEILATSNPSQGGLSRRPRL
ncbi:MAG: MobA/MobL family protein [Rudaea sp.]|nr:MobA/MobL family protein [Rudaea sp.]